MSINTRPLDEAVFRNSFVDELSGEVAPHKRPRQVPGACYSQVEPTPVKDPHLLAWSDDFAAYLGIQKPEERGSVVDVLGGNKVLPDMKPFAARYAGHQFGNWAGQLGDGRAISLGEVQATDNSWWEIQLKGAGPTPYSRRADGRAVLRSSLREFLCSEAMHYLGVPTTRALSLVGTGDSVIRDMFYDGNAQAEKGAIVARVSPTFVRFGNFEMMAASGEIENLRALADYTIRHHFSELGEPSEEVYLRWFEEVCRRTAVMIAHWMSVGFVHGVMNTDNMSILGLTIDYGPYGWLEPYDFEWTPNTTDFSGRRYAFGQQPRIAMWNLMMLAHALSPLLTDVDDLNKGLKMYHSTLLETQRAMMQRKLGLSANAETDDEELIGELHGALSDSQMDMTIFFRRLSHLATDIASSTRYDEAWLSQLLEAASYAEVESPEHDTLRQWLPRYAERLQQETTDGDIGEKMLAANPKYVLRNYLAQNAIDAADAGDLSVLETLMHVLKTPYDEQPEHEELAAKRPEWARNKAGCATLSCSS